MLKKATTHKKIPPKVLKTSAMVPAETLQKLFIQALTTGQFPSNPKYADVTPVFKKNSPLNKENYRSVSVLRIIVSKAFEKIDAKSDKFTHKIFFIAVPVWLQKGL